MTFLSVFAVQIVRQNTKVFHVSMDITKSYPASAIHTYIYFLQLSKGSVGVATGSETGRLKPLLLDPIM